MQWKNPQSQVVTRREGCNCELQWSEHINQYHSTGCRQVNENHTLYHSLLHQRGGPRNNSLCMFETPDEQGFGVIDCFCLLSSSQISGNT